ncbi:hypothetical protein K7X08_009543 [Anisodus acutangulus]|uniref:Uncharacterized protein n=1 Tax=Anisodus acutangulus TaxID=402998 RepID=A0A9Q1MZJ5_9SOLA|nr:hypothetical protein K7X08_009543 [Anisodus acutangulus]
MANHSQLRFREQLWNYLQLVPKMVPILFLNDSTSKFAVNCKSSFLVQLKQYGLRTPQCTIQGTALKNYGNKL